MLRANLANILHLFLNESQEILFADDVAELLQIASISVVVFPSILLLKSCYSMIKYAIKGSVVCVLDMNNLKDENDKN